MLGAVEGGQKCNSTTCAIGTIPDLLVLLNRTLNISASDTVSDSLFSLAHNDFQIQDRINFNSPWAYKTTEISTCLSQGQAGYYSFTPIYRCIDGTLFQCKGAGFPADGTSVQLCAVGTLSNNMGLDGTLNFVTTIGFDELPPLATNATLPANQSNMANTSKVLAPIWLFITVMSIMLWMQ